MSRRLAVYARILGAAALLAFVLTACSDGEGPDVEFDCEDHDECLDDEACLDELCVDAPTEGQECPDEHDGEIYEELRCVDGVWEATEQPDGPAIQSVDAEPPTADPDEAIELSADVDYENPDDLDWEWTAPSGWELVEDDEAVVELTAHADWGHTATIELEVADPYDQSDSGEVVTSTHDLEGPEIEALEVDPNPVLPGEVQMVAADVAHPLDLEIDDYDWSIPDAWELEGDDEGAEVEIVAPGEHGVSDNVELTVIDTENQDATASAGVSTETNPGPTFDAVEADPPVLEPEATAQVEVVEPAHELGHEIDEFNWSVEDDDWMLETDVDGDDDKTVEVTAPGEYEAQTEVSIELVDEYDESNEGTVQLEVEPEDNQPPEIDELYLDDNPVEADGSTQAHVEADDPTSSDDPDFEWSIEGDDWQLEVDDADDSVADVEAPDEFDDEAEITVVATGAYLKTAEETVVARTKTGENEPPVIEELIVDQYELMPGEQTEAHVEAYDPYGQDLDYDWSIGSGWTVEPADGDPTVTVTAPDEVDSQTDLEIAVTDEDDNTDDASASLETITNPGPSISSVDADETDDIGPGQEVDVTVDADHDAGFDLFYAWELDNDDWEIVDGANQSTATVQAPDAPESVVDVTAVVTDGYDGATQESVTLETFDNQAPIIDEDQTGADPEGPFELGEEFELFVDAEDPTGDDAGLTYQWETDGDWDIDDDESATTDVWAPDQTETEPVTITVTDEWDYSTTETVEVETFDYVVDDFEFEDVEDADPETWVVSEKVELEGFDAPGASASCDGCELKRHYDSGSTDWVDELEIDEGFEAGDEIEIRVESDVFEETVEASVQVGETESETWSVTTKEAQLRELTTCGTDGRLGPDQSDCDDEYDGPLGDEIEVEDGIQQWTVPAGGTYEIEAAGAQGTGPGDDDFEPGLGAEVIGEFDLEEGEEIAVVVGQQGEFGSEEAGGGGGTFIARDDGGWEPIVVAGGGGGVYGDDDTEDFDTNPERHGQADESGGAGEGSLEGGDGGTDGEEGEPVEYLGMEVFGGAGFWEGDGHQYSPDAFVEGAAGGDRNSSDSDGVADGGFGAGGSVTDDGGDCSGGACCGGGGGYSGGGAARSGSGSIGWCAAGGGGSYNADDDGFEFDGEQEGDGRVTIDWGGPQ